MAEADFDQAMTEQELAAWRSDMLSKEQVFKNFDAACASLRETLLRSYERSWNGDQGGNSILVSRPGQLQAVVEFLKPEE